MLLCLGKDFSSVLQAKHELNIRMQETRYSIGGNVTDLVVSWSLGTSSCLCMAKVRHIRVVVCPLGRAQQPR